MNSTYRRYVLAVCGWWIAMSLGVLAEAGLVIDNTQISILGQTQMKQIFKNLDSINTLERRSAQLELTHYLENLEAAQRPSVIQDLIYAFPSTRYHIKLGICDALGSLNFFWEAADHEATIHFLYTEYLQEDDERLKKAMDNALMRAKGLYRDAINDYNTDQIGDSVVKKFTATFENYPKSSYAPMAHFYLGRYYTRAYLILQQREEQPTEKYLSTSNAVFQTLLDRLTEGIYQPREEHVVTADAVYFRSLNFVLLDQLDAAMAELAAIETGLEPADDTIYIYQFYYSRQSQDIVDTYFPSAFLAQYTREYLEQHGGLNPADLSLFLKGLFAAFERDIGQKSY